MKNRILWIEDDYYFVKGLLRPIEKEGFEIISSTSANDAFKRVQSWKDYAIIIVDLILPPTDEEMDELAPEVEKWNQEEYIGIGLIKYMLNELHCTVPIMVLSVAANELADALGSLRVDRILLKRGLLPHQVQEAIHEVLERSCNEESRFSRRMP